MKTQYVTADELVDTLGVSKGKAYQIIRQLNEELAEQGYIKIAGSAQESISRKDTMVTLLKASVSKVLKSD